MMCKCSLSRPFTLAQLVLIPSCLVDSLAYSLVQTKSGGETADGPGVSV